MDEAMRHEVVQRHEAGASIRSIDKDLSISRGAVVRALARVQAQREGRAAPWPGPRRQPRQSIVDPFEPILKELLARYPNLTVERALQELRQRGFRGGYTVVAGVAGARDRLGPLHITRRRLCRLDLIDGPNRHPSGLQAPLLPLDRPPLARSPLLARYRPGMPGKLPT